MVAMLGMAVEFSRTLNARDAMQSAVNSAVLAARNADGQDQIAIAQKYFKANLKKVIGKAEANFTRTGAGNLAGSAIVDIKTPFLGMAGTEKVTVEVTALAKPDSEIDLRNGSRQQRTVHGSSRPVWIEYLLAR